MKKITIQDGQRLDRQFFRDWLSENPDALSELNFDNYPKLSDEDHVRVRFITADLPDSGKTLFLDELHSFGLAKRQKNPVTRRAHGKHNENKTVAVPDTRDESNTADLIGTILIWFSLGAGILGVLFLGRAEVETGVYYTHTETIWSLPIIAVCIGAGLNGAFFGYLLKKIASILRHLGSIKNTTANQ